MKKITILSFLSIIFFQVLGQDKEKQAAQDLINNLNSAKPVAEGENKIGIFISSVSKSGKDYIVSWDCSNELIKNNAANQTYAMSMIYFIDPENYENNYQPFTIKNGQIEYNFEAGDEISTKVLRVKFEPKSKVMYMYFKGVPKGGNNPPALFTVPLFFTIVLTDKPYVLEKTPRQANTLFDKALIK